MANIMTKRGTQDNVVTYEHMCDSHDDLANIPQNQITLGSIAIVLKDNDNQIGVYMADSNKEWLSLLTMGGNSNSSAPSTVDLLHVLTANEYDAVTHIPTIAYPETNIVYLVPSANQDDNNLFDEWIYTGSNWERFGGASVSANIQPDWNQNDENAADYIKNRICYIGDPVEEILVDEEVNKVAIDTNERGISSSGTTPILFNYSSNDIFEFSYAGNVLYRGTLQDYGNSYQFAFPAQSELYGDYFEIYENYRVDIYSQHSSIYNNWPDSGRLVVKHIESHIEKLNPGYLPFNIRAGDNEGIIEGDIVHNIASGLFSHVQGGRNEATGQFSHAQGGSNIASGDYSHTQGNSTIANHRSQHVFGQYNLADPNSDSGGIKGDYVEIVGNGITNARSNARTLDWSGNEWLAGTLTTSTNGIKIGNTTLTESQLQALLALLE